MVLIERFRSTRNHADTLRVRQTFAKISVLSPLIPKVDEEIRFSELVRRYQVARTQFLALTNGEMELDDVTTNGNPPYSKAQLRSMMGKLDTIIANCDSALFLLTGKVSHTRGDTVSSSERKETGLLALYHEVIKHEVIRKETESLYSTGHYAQAIFEAYKTLNNLVKNKSGLDLDGKDLMAQAFSEKNPILKLNKMKTQSEKDEQIGFKLILMGVMIGIRNPKAHDSIRQTDPIRTLEYLALADLLATRIDETESVRS
jgi:uncharacterized protein (TIGR02391 family)